MAPLGEGIKGYYTEEVLYEHSAARVGSGLLEVFSTPSLVAMMEKTAHESIQQYLKEGDGSVGAQITVRHLQPTAIGDRIRVESVVQEVDGRKVTFFIQAWDKKGLIGEANHVRYIIDTKKFMAKIN